MLSSWFGALGLGDLVAPRPNPLTELLSLVRSNQQEVRILSTYMRYFGCNILRKRSGVALCTVFVCVVVIVFKSLNRFPTHPHSSSSPYTQLALQYLESCSEIIDLDAVDPRSGLNALHISAATGSLMVLVDLLSRGADVGAMCTSADSSMAGSRALHFAAMNDRKQVVEVLLRSGADPSVPNDAGK